LSRKGLHAAVKAVDVSAVDVAGSCDACFSGDYPIQIGGHRARR
jgi:hypothetical protein